MEAVEGNEKGNGGMADGSGNGGAVTDGAGVGRTTGGTVNLDPEGGARDGTGGKPNDNLYVFFKVQIHTLGNIFGGAEQVSFWRSGFSCVKESFTQSTDTIEFST